MDNRSPLQLIKKRINNCEESNSTLTKKIKRSIDVATHWKKIQSINKTNTTKTYECNSKTDCKIKQILLINHFY